MINNSYKDAKTLVISKDIEFYQALEKTGLKNIRYFHDLRSIANALSDSENALEYFEKLSTLKDIDLAFIEVEPERNYEVFNYEEELLYGNNDAIRVYFYKAKNQNNQTTFNAYFFEGQFTSNDYDELLTKVFEELPKPQNKHMTNKKN